MDLHNVYILTGPEQGEKEDFVHEIKKEMRKQYKAQAEQHVLYASEDNSVHTLLLLLNNYSLFGTSRIIEFYGAEAVQDSSSLKELAAYIGKPAKDAVLLLISKEYHIHSSLESAANAATAARSGSSASIKVFFEIKDIREWLAKQLKSYKLELDADATELLLQLVENNSHSLGNACKIFSQYFTPGYCIARKEVEETIAPNKQVDPFSIYEKIITNNLEQALESLEFVLAERAGGGEQILAPVLWCFRRLAAYQEAIEQNSDKSAVFKDLRIFSTKAQRQIQMAAKRFTRIDCANILWLGSTIESYLRSSGAKAGQESGLLQLFIYGIIKKNGKLHIERKAYPSLRVL